MNLSIRVVGSSFLLFFAVLLTVLTAAQLPQPQGHITQQNERLFYSPGSGQTSVPIRQFHCASNNVKADVVLAIDEPDVLATFAAFNALMANHSCLAASIEQTGALHFTDDDGQRHSIEFRPRRVLDLSWIFWLQLTIGSIVSMIGLSIWAAKPTVATSLYLLTGACLTLSVFTAGIYSSRSLFINGELFLRLSQANNIGANLFSGSLAALLWNYPRKLGSQAITALCLIASVAFCIAIVGQLASGPTVSYTGTLSVYSLAFVFAYLQWRLTRRAPVERAALLWFLLAIFIGTGLFAALQLVPAALKIESVVSQALSFVVFLFMYVGLAMGLLRYRLFDIGRWWFAIWSWLLGGIAVLFVDALLLWTTALNKTAAISLAVALIGWVYFPVRQWLWAKFIQPTNWQPEQVLQKAIPQFVGIRSNRELLALWPMLLDEVFKPLQIQAITHRSEPTIDNGGQTLRFTSHGGTQGYALTDPDKGRRLFNRDDITLVELLISQFSLAEHSLNAKDEGRVAERDRIRSDIHDDLGAHLLQLLHRSAESERPLVREAIKDLRELLDALDDVSQPLSDFLALCECEVKSRCNTNATTLNWQQDLALGSQLVAAETRHQLLRIFRELISNALRHAEPSAIDVRISQPTKPQLRITVSNDGLDNASLNAAANSRPADGRTMGMGSRIMRKRAAALNGEVHTEIANGRWTNTVNVTIS